MDSSVPDVGQAPNSGYRRMRMITPCRLPHAKASTRGSVSRPGTATAGLKGPRLTSDAVADQRADCVGDGHGERAAHDDAQDGA